MRRSHSTAPAYLLLQPIVMCRVQKSTKWYKVVHYNITVNSVQVPSVQQLLQHAACYMPNVTTCAMQFSWVLRFPRRLVHCIRAELHMHSCTLNVARARRFAHLSVALQREPDTCAVALPLLQSEPSFSAKPVPTLLPPSHQLLPPFHISANYK